MRRSRCRRPPKCHVDTRKRFDKRDAVIGVIRKDMTHMKAGVGGLYIRLPGQAGEIDLLK